MASKNPIVICDGKEDDVYKLLRYFGISNDQYSYRVRKGMTPQEAFDSCLKTKESILYRGENKKLLELLSQYGIRYNSYNYRISKGMTPQEAIDSCIAVKNAEVTYAGKKEDVYKLLHQFGINSNYYSSCVRKGMSPQEAFEKCLRSQCGFQVLEKIPNEELRKRGLPENFSSLFQFCSYARLDYKDFLKLWVKFPLYTLRKLYQEYLKLGPIVSSKEDVYYGVSLRAMCLFFQLPYFTCSKILQQNPNINLEELFRCVLIGSFPDLIQNFLNRVGNISSLEQLEDVCVRYRIGEKAKLYLVSYVQRMNFIHDALCAYQMVYFFEEEWNFLYEDDIEELQMSSKSKEEFSQKLRSFRQSVFSNQRENWNISQSSIQNFYKNYYSSYLKDISKNGESCWGYNRKLTKINIK